MYKKFQGSNTLIMFCIQILIEFLNMEILVKNHEMGVMWQGGPEKQELFGVHMHKPFLQSALTESVQQ